MGEHKRFGGDQKVGTSILSGPEHAFRDWGTPKVPARLETYHLTLLTLPWACLNPLFGWLAQDNLHWLWMVSLMIVLQYVTDVFDGAVGRSRNTGLIKWGFYMDHFMDYIFLGSLVFTGYLISPPEAQIYYIPLLIIVGGFMVSSYLNFSATNEFRIYYLGLGPTEMRIGLIGINTLGCLLFLILLVWNTHRELWKLDMEGKGS